MPLSLLNHSALALFAQRTRIPTSARSIGFCAIWVCISSSSSSMRNNTYRKVLQTRVAISAKVRSHSAKSARRSTVQDVTCAVEWLQVLQTNTQEFRRRRGKCAFNSNARCIKLEEHRIEWQDVRAQRVQAGVKTMCVCLSFFEDKVNKYRKNSELARARFCLSRLSSTTTGQTDEQTVMW